MIGDPPQANYTVSFRHHVGGRPAAIARAPVPSIRPVSGRGRPSYMAPRQAFRAGNPDARPGLLITPSLRYRREPGLRHAFPARLLGVFEETLQQFLFLGPIPARKGEAVAAEETLAFDVGVLE